MLKWTKTQEWFKCMHTICQFDQKNNCAAIQIIEFHETQCMNGFADVLFCCCSFSWGIFCGLVGGGEGVRGGMRGGWGGEMGEIPP